MEFECIYHRAGKCKLEMSRQCNSILDCPGVDYFIRLGVIEPTKKLEL